MRKKDIVLIALIIIAILYGIFVFSEIEKNKDKIILHNVECDIYCKCDDCHE